MDSESALSLLRILMNEGHTRFFLTHFGSDTWGLEVSVEGYDAGELAAVSKIVTDNRREARLDSGWLKIQ